MIKAIKSLFGSKEVVNFKSLMDEGAIIIDVRTKGEFAGGHIPNSVNVPGNGLRSYVAELKDKNVPIITCCASGIRSAAAKTFLKKEGYQIVHNGGGWASLQKKIS